MAETIYYTKHRSSYKCKNDFDKDFFKLMNNSVFGKTMENIRNRVDIRLVNDRRKTEKLAAKPNFKTLDNFLRISCQFT